MYTKLRILRPLVVAEAQRCVTSTVMDSSEKTFAPNLPFKVRADMCRLCVSTAHDVLDELHAHLCHVNRSSPWHSLYRKSLSSSPVWYLTFTHSSQVTFAAASVLVAASLCPYLDTRLESGISNSSWNKALGIFRFHNTHVASADKGLEMMERLRQAAEAKRPRVEGKCRDYQCDTVEVNFFRLLGRLIPGGPELLPTNAGSSVASTIEESHDHPFDSDLMTPHLVDFEAILDSALLDHQWLTSQDFGLDDWMLNLA